MGSIEQYRGYDQFVAELKERIQRARVKAISLVNAELLSLYWGIGRDILDRQAKEGWGTDVVNRLARDLKSALPGQTGYSPRNLKYMRSFAGLWSMEEVVQAPLAQLSWYHQVALLEKLPSTEVRRWYARKAVEYGWSRNVLVHQIESNLIERQGRASTNFELTLPAPQSDLAKDLFKDPYNLEFLTLREAAHERELEQALIDDLRKFLLELGAGFAFLDRQSHLEIGGADYYTDLLFYHVKLHCYVVIDLKVTEFRPEFAGKMNFYVNAVDDRLRDKSVDNPTIGLILCKTHDKQVVEYALRGNTTPIGVSTYKLGEPEKKALALDEIKNHLAEIDTATIDASAADEQKP